VPARESIVRRRRAQATENSALAFVVCLITIENNGKQPLELPYRVTPLEHFVVELHGEQGKPYKIQHSGEKVDKAQPGTLTVPAGKSNTLSLHTCHYLPALGEGEQKVTFIARLKHDGKTIESKPLTVNP
jgi:hypothetical protein